jgi:hypothetical protein
MKYDIGLAAKNWPSILTTPIQWAWAVSKHTFFLLKSSYHQISPASGCEGVETDLSLSTNHKWRFQASYRTDLPGL